MNSDPQIGWMVQLGARIVADMGANTEALNRLRQAIANLSPTRRSHLALNLVRSLVTWEISPLGSQSSCRDLPLVQDLHTVLVCTGVDVPIGAPAQLLGLIDEGVKINTLKKSPRLHKAQARVTTGVINMSDYPGTLMLAVLLLSCTALDFHALSRNERPPSATG